MKTETREDFVALARSLGLVPESKTFRKFLAGKISKEEAMSRGKEMTKRHEESEYDDLLCIGVSRKKARKLMWVDRDKEKMYREEREDEIVQEL